MFGLFLVCSVLIPFQLLAKAGRSNSITWSVSPETQCLPLSRSPPDSRISIDVLSSLARLAVFLWQSHTRPGYHIGPSGSGTFATPFFVGQGEIEYHLSLSSYCN